MDRISVALRGIIMKIKNKLSNTLYYVHVYSFTCNNVYIPVKWLKSNKLIRFIMLFIIHANAIKSIFYLYKFDNG